MPKQRLVNATNIVKRILEERDKIALETTERYGLGVKVPCRFGQAMRGGIRKALREIEMEPTVDAVEVVRCKDCYHRGDDMHCPMCRMESYWDEFDGWDYSIIDDTVDEGYCHCGERYRDEEEIEEEN